MRKPATVEVLPLHVAPAPVYAHILAQSGEPIAIIDTEGRYLEQNAAHARLLGYSDAELAGRTPALHMGDAAFAAVVATLRSTGTFRGVVACRTRDGRTAQVELHAFALRDENGELLGYVGFKRDMTASLQAQQELARRYEQLQLLYRITEAVSRAGGLEQIYEEALNGLERAIGAPRAALLLYDADGVMRFHAWRRLSEEYRAAVEGHSPWKRDDPAPQPVTLSDVAAEESLGELRDVVRLEGIGALAFVPLLDDGALIGKFMVYFDEAHAFTDGELQLAQAIANTVAAAISRRRGEDALRRAVEAQRFLAEASSTLSSWLGAERTLRAVAELATPVLADACYIALIDSDGAVVRVAASHAGNGRHHPVPQPLHLPAEILESHPGIAAIRTGATQSCAPAPREVLEAIALSREERARLVGLEPAALLAVPLLARGRTMGAITLLRSGGTAFDDELTQLAHELARRTAVAIENARLFEAANIASRAKSDFLAVISHELRTPLNAILGYSDLMRLGIPAPLPDTAQTHIERVRASATHLLGLIDQILTFSGLEAGRVRLRPESVDAAELLRETTDIVRPLARNRGLRLRVLAPRTPVPAELDRGRVRQILLNLLSNAIKFTEAGRIHASVRADGDEVVFRVRDTGIGIPADQHEHIFEPFWQADHSRTRHIAGTGLGLSVSRELAAAMDGSLTVESNPGGGSTFTLRVPIGTNTDRASALDAATPST